MSPLVPYRRSPVAAGFSLRGATAGIVAGVTTERTLKGAATTDDAGPRRF